MKVEDQIETVAAAVRILRVLTMEPSQFRLFPSQARLMDRLKDLASEMTAEVDIYERKVDEMMMAAADVPDLADYNSAEQAIITKVAGES